MTTVFLNKNAKKKYKTEEKKIYHLHLNIVYCYCSDTLNIRESLSLILDQTIFSPLRIPLFYFIFVILMYSKKYK